MPPRRSRTTPSAPVASRRGEVQRRTPPGADHAARRSPPGADHAARRSPPGADQIVFLGTMVMALGLVVAVVALVAWSMPATLWWTLGGLVAAGLGWLIIKWARRERPPAA